MTAYFGNILMFKCTNCACKWFVGNIINLPCKLMIVAYVAKEV